MHEKVFIYGESGHFWCYLYIYTQFFLVIAYIKRNRSKIKLHICISICTLIKSLCFQFQHQKGFGQISEQIYNGLFNSLKEIHYLHLKSKLVKLHCTCMYAGARRQFCFGIQNFYQRMKNFSMKTFIWNSDWLLIKWLGQNWSSLL